MYKVISITEYEMTRDVVLQNLDTGEIDVCFDDSALMSDENNFDFMEIGGVYDCKIKLFGVVEEENGHGNVKCRTIKTLDYCKMVMVEVGQNVYYVPMSEFQDGVVKPEFYFGYTRKDLMEVDNVLHKYYC